MKILYIGNFEPSHSTETHISLTLQSMGHTVYQAQENELRAERIANYVRTLHPDLVLYTRTWGFLDGPGAGMDLWAQCAALGIPTASYHLDLYFGLQREDTMAGDPFWQTDFCFTPDGGHPTEFLDAGINHHYIKPGVYKGECYLGTPNHGDTFDVGFVGSWESYHHAEYPYRRQLVHKLMELYGPRFHAFGSDAGEGNRWWRRGAALNDTYASVKVIVGDSLCLNFTHPFYWSDRVYETPGRGGFLIHPYIDGLDAEFTNHETITFYQYGDLTELSQLINHYVTHDTEREKIRLAAHEYVKANCTYNNRLAQAINIIGVK